MPLVSPNFDVQLTELAKNPTDLFLESVVPGPLAKAILLVRKGPHLISQTLFKSITYLAMKMHAEEG